MNGTLGFALKLIVSVSLIGWLLWQENPARIWDMARHANLGVMALGFVLYLLAITVGAYKWGVLLQALDIRVPLVRLVRSTFVGLFFGNFLPSNVGGDVVRAFDLSQFTENGPATSASVIVDRLTGLIVFVGSAALASVITAYWLGEPVLWTIAWLSIGLFAASLGVFLAMTNRALARKARFVFQIVPRLNPVRATTARVADAFHAYNTRPLAVIYAAGLSFGTQCLTSVVNWLMSVALGFNVPFVYFFLFNSLIAFILLVPISINGIGVKQAVYVFFYSTLTGLLTESQALTMSILMHTIIISSGLLGGLVWLQRARQAKQPELVGHPAILSVADTSGTKGQSA